MGHPHQVQVDPARLTAIAAEVARAATTLTKAHGSCQAQLAPAGQDGWSAAVAARSAQAAWGSFVTDLARSVAGLANDLTAAAQAYVASDEAAARRMPHGRVRPI